MMHVQKTCVGQAQDRGFQMPHRKLVHSFELKSCSAAPAIAHARLCQAATTPKTDWSDVIAMTTPVVSGPFDVIHAQVYHVLGSLQLDAGSLQLCRCGLCIPANMYLGKRCFMSPARSSSLSTDSMSASLIAIKANSADWQEKEVKPL